MPVHIQVDIRVFDKELEGHGAIVPSLQSDTHRDVDIRCRMAMQPVNEEKTANIVRNISATY